MGFRSFPDECFPALLSCFSSSRSGWKLCVPDIGTNSGFPSSFDWNDHFDDDDGALVIAQTRFDEVSQKPGFKAVDEGTGAFAFVSFQRSGVWEDGILNYRIVLPTVVKTSSDRDVGINMELSAVFATIFLQMQTDWLWLIEELKSHSGHWTIRTVIESSQELPDSVKEAFYEISSDAACRFYDDYPGVGHFTGFEEPVLTELAT